MYILYIWIIYTLLCCGVTPAPLPAKNVLSTHPSFSPNPNPSLASFCLLGDEDGKGWTKITCKSADMVHHSNSNHRDDLCMVLCNSKRFSIFYPRHCCSALGLGATIIQWRTSYKKKKNWVGGPCRDPAELHLASSERIKQLA